MSKIYKKIIIIGLIIIFGLMAESRIRHIEKLAKFNEKTIKNHVIVNLVFMNTLNDEIIKMRSQQSLTPMSQFREIKKVIQHRVLSYDDVLSAMDKGANYFECDIQKAKDGLIMYHDKYIKYKGKQYYSCELTIQQIKEAYGDKVLTLKEYLNLPYMENIKYVFHITNWSSHFKNYNKEITEQIINTLKNTKTIHGNSFIDNVDSFISFDIRQLTMIKKLLPKVAVGYCVDYHLDKGIYSIDLQKYLTIDQLIKRAKINKIELIVYPALALGVETMHKLVEASLAVMSGVTIPKALAGIEGVVLDDIVEFRHMQNAI